jgi:hypothetical protein
MKTYPTLIIILFLFLGLIQCKPTGEKKEKEPDSKAVAQKDQGPGQKGSNSERIERYKAEKIAYMTENLNLTPAEAQNFWPIYNEFEKERFSSQGKRHELDRKIMGVGDSITDKDILELNRSLVQSFQDEADVVKKYNEKLMKVLPARKVLLIYKAENQFRMEMIRKYRDRQGGPQGGPQNPDQGQKPPAK